MRRILVFLVAVLAVSRFFAASAPAVVADAFVQLTTSPRGGWTFQGNPMALTENGYTYIGYIDGSGNVKLAVATAGGFVTSATLHTLLETDDHDNPTLFVRPDGKLQTFYSKHIGTNIYQRISNATLADDPTLASGFDTEQSLSSTFGSSAATYPSTLYLTNNDGAGDEVFVFWREIASGDGQWWYSSNDFSGGWFGHAVLHTLDYSKIDTDGVGRIDMIASNHPDDGANVIKHLYRESAHWHTSSGTNLGSLPYGPSDLTTVYTASGSDILWVADLVSGGTGHPVALFYRWPSDDTSDVRIMWSRWTGSVWDTHEVVAAGGYIPSSVEYPPGSFQTHYPGGAALDHNDPNIVYVSRKVSGQWEMFKYVTANSGTTFTGTQLTFTSTNKQVRPIGVRNQDDLAAVWGDYTDYTNYVTYSAGIRGVIP